MKTIKLTYGCELSNDYTGIVDYDDGYKCWYLNGKLHREDGPAVEDVNGNYWFLDGKLHRKDGPAVEYSTGNNAYWLNDKHYTESEYRIEMMIRNCTLGKLLMKRTQL